MLRWVSTDTSRAPGAAIRTPLIEIWRTRTSVGTWLNFSVRWPWH